MSLEKTAQFVRDVTEGALSPSVGMINGLCREFSSKSRQEQDRLFTVLPCSMTMRRAFTAMVLTIRSVWCI